jgi:hypothetical protein
MNAHEFFDTNILLYSQVDECPEKKAIAKSLLADKILYGEFLPFLRRLLDKIFLICYGGYCRL